MHAHVRRLARFALGVIAVVVASAGVATPAHANPGCVPDTVSTVTVAEGGSVVDDSSVGKDCTGQVDSMTVLSQPNVAGVVIEVGGGLAPKAYRVVATSDYFTPPGGEPLTAQLTVTGNGVSVQRPVRITVTNTPDAPACSGMAITTAEDSPTASTPLGCSDADGDPITGYAIAVPPAHGAATLQGGSYVYTPSLNYNGSDAFTVDVAQGAAHTNVTVGVIVAPTADPSSCVRLTLGVLAGATTRGRLSCSDPDGAITSYAIATKPSRGTALATGSSVEYASWSTTGLDDVFGVRVREGGASLEFIVRVDVIPRPTAGNDRVVGSVVADTLNGGRGNDTIDGRAGGDTLLGGPGIDRLTGGAGADRLTGGPGVDSHSGGVGDDTINALDARGVRDTIACGAGRDTVIANAADRVAPDCERVTRRP